MNSTPESEPDTQSPTRLQAIRTGLLISGSVLLGGLAVVLWNRTSLSRLRQPTDEASQPSTEPDDEEV